MAVPLPEGYKFNREEIYDERFDQSVLGRAMRESEIEFASTTSGKESHDAE
jgi:hypothetical protein